MTKERVLVVDDEPINVKIIASCLENEGYDVFKAYDGTEALRITRESKPDVIILDVMMPGLDGFEVTKQLRQNPDTNIIPIILLTALGATKDKVKGLNVGADDFLTKPTNFYELRARVRSLLKLKQLHEKAFSINNSDAHLVTQGDDTPKEKNIILIIEDDVIEAKKSSSILVKAGYNTITASTAQEAEEILNNSVPDLILLDIMLPDRSGIELLATLRGKLEFENLPIIIVSSIDDLITKVKGIDT
ncbi:MAG: response regulator, partial [Deltaproteobacteria bacterium]